MARDAAVILVLMVAVVGAGGYALYDHYQQKADSRPVEAVITHSEYIPSTSPETDAVVEIEYRYTVDGETHNGTDVCPGPTEGGCYDSPEDVADRYPEGNTATAYVDSDDPSESYLIDRGTPYALFLMTGGGVLFSLFVLYDMASDDPDWKTE